MDKSFEELARDPAGTIYFDEEIDGVRCMIMRGPYALCAYMGIPIEHPLAKIGGISGAEAGRRAMEFLRNFSRGDKILPERESPTYELLEDMGSGLRVHGGLTYSDVGDGDTWPKNALWIGWDYAHHGDRPFFVHDVAFQVRSPKLAKHYEDEYGWLVLEVLEEIKQAVPQLKLLMSIAEELAAINVETDDGR